MSTWRGLCQHQLLVPVPALTVALMMRYESFSHTCSYLSSSKDTMILLGFIVLVMVSSRSVFLIVS
ncbi:hypothetical protein BDV97DRAFT_24909 [Delphinella strobiligena]|nr:hypothetical protein BDV97DRAFT_24909 [Delphinella strobiligena]